MRFPVKSVWFGLCVWQANIFNIVDRTILQWRIVEKKAPVKTQCMEGKRNDALKHRKTNAKRIHISNWWNQNQAAEQYA